MINDVLLINVCTKYLNMLLITYQLRKLCVCVCIIKYNEVLFLQLKTKDYC